MEKKMMKKLAVVMVFGALGLGIAATSQAAGGSSGGSAPAPTIAPITTITISPNPCPAGWQLVKGSKSGDDYTCTATKTQQMIQCPDGMDYYDTGCFIGCNATVK